MSYVKEKNKIETIDLIFFDLSQSYFYAIAYLIGRSGDRPTVRNPKTPYNLNEIILAAPGSGLPTYPSWHPKNDQECQ